MPMTMPVLFNFDMAIIAIALACRFLLPSRALIAFPYKGRLMGVSMKELAFWLVLAIGVLVFIVKFIRKA